MMTVSELMEELQYMNPEMEVFFMMFPTTEEKIDAVIESKAGCVFLFSNGDE